MPAVRTVRSCARGVKQRGKPCALVLTFGLTNNARDFGRPTLNTAHARRPAHLLDVLKALLVSGEEFVSFADIHALILAE